MALKTGDQVEFFYAGQTSQLPVQRKENTIYFDAEGQQIFIGEQLIASVDNSVDLSSYVTKNGAIVIDGLTIAPSNINKGVNNIQWTDSGFHFYAFDEATDTSVPAVLDGIAEPTEDNQAANKKYVDDAIIEMSDSEDSSEEISLGQTPITLTKNASKLILSGIGSHTYTINSETQIEADILNGTPSNAVLTYEDNQYKLKANSGISSWYQSYIDINISGLVQGTTYNFIFDGANCTYNEETHVTVGHFILYDGNDSTLVTRGNLDTNKKNVYPFTATTTTARIRWYPATNNTFQAGVSVANINGFYFNRQGTTNHTAILNLSGSFTNFTRLKNIPANCLIDADPDCQVSYKVGEDTDYAPFKDKKIVCFGDSLFGMYRGDTSATSYIEQYTGATVYNVGFGGCRMSTHPSHGYAEFSMYRLAQAIANNDWEDQDTYASQGSDYFPEQLAVLKDIDFDQIDYAVIHYGTNDFGAGVAIDDNDNKMNPSTICGALRVSISNLLQAYPKLQLFISLPVYRYWTSNGTNYYAETYKNSQGNILPEVVKAMRKVAVEYHLPIIDGYYGMGINSINASQFLEDGTHHNQAGRERFGTFIAQELLSPTNYVTENPIEIRLSAAGTLPAYDGTNTSIPYIGPTWTELYEAISNAKEIHLIVDDGVYVIEKYTSYSFDGDIEVLRFFAPSNATNLGFYTIEEGTNNSLRVTYASFPNANTLSF